LDDSVFASFEGKREEPTADEGFREVKQVNWIFEGSPSAKSNWNMWLAVSGK
jgi:bifunctional polynucleotide phosphatase/kinase